MLTKQQIKSAGSIFYANSAGCNPRINVIEELAECLQYAPMDTGAPLSDKECNELNVSIYGGVSAEAIAVINRILAKRVRKVSPAALDSDLVEAAINVWFEGATQDDKDFIKRMTAVVRVIADALLGPVTDEEFHAKVRMMGSFVRGMEIYNACLADRRARLEAKPKTLEERVTYEGGADGWFVCVDRRRCGPVFDDEDVAEVFRLGLIAKMAKEAQ